MKKSIVKKLFFVTSVFFILFITSIFLTQSLFFESFYIDSKVKNLCNNTEKIKIQYNKYRKSNPNGISELIKSFEEANNSKVVILNDRGQLIYVTNFENRPKDAFKVRIIQDVVYKQLNSGSKLNDFLKKNQSTSYITSKKDDDTRHIVYITPNQATNEIMFSISSLQPVNEAADVIKKFYLYFYICGIGLVLILSLIYSNMISKPLIRLNKAASKMSKLDFSQKYIVKTQDEIGNLGTTLNFLSQNLKQAMSSLQKANSKLKEDIKKERELENMRKEFVAGVSHELKTPISLIDGYAEALKDNIVDEENRNYFIDVIIDESRKMNNLVIDMLDLAQLESGTFKLEKEYFKLDELIFTTSKKYKSMMEERNISFKENLIKDVCVYSDWERMEQVITNFLTNAISHTNENGTIVVSMELREEKVLVSVENTGKNIPEDEMAKIWSKFYKIDKSRNRDLGGTGIGLSIVKNILTKHESEYGVKNTENGVKFYFSLDVY